MAQSHAIVIEVNPREAILKRKLREHLRSLGFTKTPDGALRAPGEGKEAIRTLHSAQREERLFASENFIAKAGAKLIRYFASGSDVDPRKISPVLERVSSHTWQGELFRLASLSWSVPVSAGFGRRLRYLVWDQSNGKLMGIIAIGDPVFNLGVRDKFIGWSTKDRGARLVNLMDAYVLGAMPPYNTLLCGKLVACLLRSRDIYDDFARVYGESTGIISQQEKKARLLSIITTSSMGRSSVYNRLKLDGVQYLKSVGYTGGWGHFHIPDWLFVEMRDYLRHIDHTYADQHAFGQGPNWRLRTTRAALSALGFKDDLMKHGIQREVFVCQLATNATKILQSGRGRPEIDSLLTVEQISALALDRWVMPRSVSTPHFRSWAASDMIDLFGSQAQILRCQMIESNLIHGASRLS